jgi:hypothetical protein
MVRLSVLAVLVVTLAGCAVRIGDFTLAATKNIASLKGAEQRGIYEGSDCKVFGVPNMKEAIDRTIEEGRGNALTDAALYQDDYPFHHCFRAKGTVVQLKSQQ